MNNYRVNDYVTYEKGYYKILEINGDMLTLDTGDREHPLILKAILVQYLMKDPLSEEDIRRLIRYEDVYDIEERKNVFMNIEGIEDYEITLEDLDVALTNFEKDKDLPRLSRYWLINVWPLLINQLKDMAPSCNIYSEYTLLNNVTMGLTELVHDLDFDSTDQVFLDRFDDIHDNLVFGMNNLKLPPEKRNYSEEEMHGMLADFSYPNVIEYADEDTLATYRYLLEKDAKDNNSYSILRYAELHTKKNKAYDIDYEKATLALNHLVNTFHRNYGVDAMYSLGYLYFQGYLNGGKPNYPEAFKYLNMALVNHNDCAASKLVEMYYNGIYVPKSDATVYSIISSEYDRIFDNFILNHESQSCLCELAYYKALLIFDRIDEIFSWYEAYYFLLQARFFLHERVIGEFTEEETKLSQEIERCLKIIKKHKNYTLLQEQSICNLEHLLYFTLRGNTKVQFKINKLAAGRSFEFKLYFDPEATNEGEEPKTANRLFLTIPELDFAGYADELKFHVREDFEKVYELFDNRGIIDNVRGDVGFLGDEPVIVLNSAPFYEQGENETPEEEYQHINVTFNVHPIDKVKTEYDFAVIYLVDSPTDRIICLSDDVPNLYKGRIISIDLDGMIKRARIADLFTIHDYELVYPVEEYQHLKNFIIANTNQLKAAS